MSVREAQAQGRGQAQGFAIALTMLCTAASAHAQELRGSAVVASPSHELLGNPLGWGVSLELLDTRKIGLRAFVESLHDDFDGMGSLCTGLVQPGRDCSAEPLSESSTFKSYGVQLPVLVHDAVRWRVSVVPGARATEISSDRRPRGQEQGLSSEKWMWGVDAGVEASLQPRRSWPLWLTAGAMIGRVYPVEEKVLIDGYTPFEEPINWYGLSVSAGVTW